MMFNTLLAAAALALFSTAQAHMFINSPTPIKGTAPKDPLESTGANFPCHGVDLSTAKGGTPMAAGSPQVLSFELGAGANTAVHGGGSCQLSLTYEKDAAKLKDPKSWKVIYSILGGCPTLAQGNLEQAVACPGPDGINCVNSFNYTIPSEVRNGDAILSWTWFNTIGKREIYQNCAAVSITGGQDKLDSLPDMFVGNLVSVNQCPTKEETNLQFPNPGKYVTTMTYPANAPKKYPLALPTGQGCGAAAAGGSGGSGGSNSAAPPAYQPSAAPPVATSAPAVPSSAYNPPANSGGVFAPGASSAAPSLATSIVTVYQTTTAQIVPVPTAPAAQTGAGSSSSSGSGSGSASGSESGSSGNCASGATPCSTEGAIVCMGNNKWGLCDHGCAVPQTVAPGMQCANGLMQAAVAHKEKRESVLTRIPPHARAYRNFYGDI